MNFSERIVQDMKTAMKSGDRRRLETLRTLRAAILEFEKEKAENVVSDEESLRILTAAARKRREAIEQYRNAGREDLARNEEQELSIISGYLPEQMSETDVEAAVRNAIVTANAKDMKDFGRVMGPLMKILKGRAEGSLVQTPVRKHLGGS